MHKTFSFDHHKIEKIWILPYLGRPTNDPKKNPPLFQPLNVEFNSKKRRKHYIIKELSNPQT
jgi:hypothetical protein